MTSEQATAATVAAMVAAVDQPKRVVGDVADHQDGDIAELQFANVATARHFAEELKKHVRTHVEIASEQLYFADMKARSDGEELPAELAQAWATMRGWLMGNPKPRPVLVENSSTDG